MALGMPILSIESTSSRAITADQAMLPPNPAGASLRRPLLLRASSRLPPRRRCSWRGAPAAAAAAGSSGGAGERGAVLVLPAFLSGAKPYAELLSVLRGRGFAAGESAGASLPPSARGAGAPANLCPFLGSALLDALPPTYTTRSHHLMRKGCHPACCQHPACPPVRPPGRRGGAAGVQGLGAGPLWRHLCLLHREDRRSAGRAACAARPRGAGGALGGRLGGAAGAGGRAIRR